jgi:signal transduction histidine kinase
MSLFLFVDISSVEQREKLILETKFKNIFLSSFSHNLKTPLNSLTMNNEILERRLKGNDDCLEIVKANRYVDLFPKLKIFI